MNFHSIHFAQDFTKKVNVQETLFDALFWTKSKSRKNKTPAITHNILQRKKRFALLYLFARLKGEIISISIVVMSVAIFTFETHPQTQPTSWFL